MKLRSKSGLCLLFVFLSASVNLHAQVFTPIPTDVWPTAVHTPDTPSDIIAELRFRNWQAAWRIAKDLAIIQARKKVHSYFHSNVEMTKLAANLNKIIDDPTKTDVQKADQLLMLTDASLEPTTLPKTGTLNVTLQHSIELGVTRIEWDDKVRNGSQSGVHATAKCVGSTTSYTCGFQGAVVSTCYYRSQPHYNIYRRINGVETLITTMTGSLTSSGSASFTTADKLWKSAWNAAKYYYAVYLQGTYRDVVPDRAFFYDFQADMRPPGSTLSYRIHVVDDHFVQAVDTNHDMIGDTMPCGAGTGGATFSTIANADADGDGRMDYLTSADYSKYFAKYYGWLPVLIDSVLE
jgi:hypothetical protein